MIYPSVDDALRLHAMVLRATGGASGVRDMGLLEAAMARPLGAYAGIELYATIWEKAGALTHGIARNHPFVDGNKRTALVVGVTFLLLNGHWLEVSQDEMEAVGLGVAEGALTPADIAKWFEQNSRPDTPRARG